MTDPILWDQDAHTAAKHRVLRAYLDGWIPVLGQQALNVPGYRIGPPRLLLVVWRASRACRRTPERHSQRDGRVVGRFSGKRVGIQDLV